MITREQLQQIRDALDQAVNGSHLTGGLNHNDDELSCIAERSTDKYTKAKLRVHAERLSEALRILDAELAKVEQEPVGEYLGTKEDDCGIREECVTWKTLLTGTPLYTAPPSLQSAQPVDYLCDGARFKLSFDEKGKTHMLSGFKAELQGQWVALVDATDNRHMKAVAPVAAPKREWQGLTDKEINECASAEIYSSSTWAMSFARAIESKLKEKNT